jgi:hypothetical protein
MYVSWRQTVSDRWYHSVVTSAHRNRRDPAARRIGLVHFGSAYPGGSGDAGVPEYAQDLLVWLGNAAASGVIGNMVYDMLKSAAGRRRGRRESVVAHGPVTVSLRPVT